MSNPNVDRFQSKAFRDGGMIRMLSYAVRGLPSNFLPGEQRIDREWAIEVYEPELEKLDALGIQSRWFWSGSVGAALVSLALWPDSLELWRRLAEHEIRRDERGADAPCHLLELIFRHQDVETITRSPTFQIHLFQQSLAVAQACAHHSDYGRMFKQLPPLPDIVELLDQVRRLKGLRHTMTGFRPARVLRRFWVEPERPQVIHSATLSDARALADAAVAISGRNLSTTTLDGIQNRLAGHDTPNELSHPAALAAALVTTAEDAACWPLWTTALSGKGFRQPRGKGRPLKDTATRMQDAIIDANRQKEPARAAVHLFQRLCITIKCWHAQGERLLSNLPPKGQRDLALEKAWQRLDVPLAPELKLDSRPQELLSAAQVSDTEEQTGSDGKPCNRRGKRKRAQGSAGKRLETGRLGEEWVMAHYEDFFPEFAGSRLRDCRDVCKGYDFTLRKGKKRVFIEVKALKGPTGAIQLGDTQWKKAHKEGGRYYLVVVFGVRSDDPFPLVLADPASVLEPERRVVITRQTKWIVDEPQLRALLERHENAAKPTEQTKKGAGKRA